MDAVIGRDQELATLREFLTGSREGARALVLEGEAGIGKTTLWQEGLSIARGRRLRVLSARPAMAERGLAHIGLGDLFDQYLEELLPAMPAPRRSALEVALLLADAGGRPPDAGAVGVAVLTALRWLARSGPLLVAIDDVQWLDPSSAAALEFALRRLTEDPLLVLLTRRVHLPGPTPEAGLATERIDRLPVGPLSLGATHRLLLSRLGRSLPRPALVRVHEVAGGNPFFALELALALEQADHLPVPGEQLPVPESLESLVRGRLDRLPAASSTVLLAAAALADPTVPQLSSGWPDAAAALDPALDAGIIHLVDDRVRFDHPLLASVLYEHAPREQRRSIHRQLANLVADPGEQARHLALAADGPDSQVAQRLDAAAAGARTRGAPITAAELSELAVRATPADQVEDRRRRLLQAARDHVAAGSPSRVRALVDTVLHEAPSGRARAEALLVASELEEGAGMLNRQVALLRSALREVSEPPDGAPPDDARSMQADADIRATIELSLAEALRLSEGADAAVAQARRAAHLAERSGDDALLARALATLARAKLDAGEAGAIALAERSLAHARNTQDQVAIDESLWACGYCCAFAGEVAMAREAFARCRNSVAGRDDQMEAVILWLLALVELRGGNWPLARQCAEQSVELSQMLAGGDPQDDPEAAVTLALVAAYQSDHARARHLSTRGLQLAEASDQPFFVSWYDGILGLLEHWGGHPDAAVESFARAMRIREALCFREPASPPYRVDYVEALLALGRIEEALAVLEPWESAAVRLGRRWALAETTRSRGLVAAARGDVEDAARLLTEAVTRHQEVGDRFGGARALLALGVVRRRARQKQAARETIQQALTEFERLGAQTWVDKARAELGSIGGRTREEGLTAAERRVAELAAQGRTNREVAAALFLSERTVESHLTHVYAKLGVRSRTELSRSLR